MSGVASADAGQYNDGHFRAKVSLCWELCWSLLYIAPCFEMAVIALACRCKRREEYTQFDLLFSSCAFISYIKGRYGVGARYLAMLLSSSG